MQSRGTTCGDWPVRTWLFDRFCWLYIWFAFWLKLETLSRERMWINNLVLGCLFAFVQVWIFLFSNWS